MGYLKDIHGKRQTHSHFLSGEKGKRKLNFKKVYLKRTQNNCIPYKKNLALCTERKVRKKSALDVNRVSPEAQAWESRRRKVLEKVLEEPSRIVGHSWDGTGQRCR